MTHQTSGNFDELLKDYRKKYDGEIGSRAKGPILSHDMKNIGRKIKEFREQQQRKKEETA